MERNKKMEGSGDLGVVCSYNVRHLDNKTLWNFKAYMEKEGQGGCVLDCEVHGRYKKMNMRKKLKRNELYNTFKFILRQRPENKEDNSNQLECH